MKKTLLTLGLIGLSLAAMAQPKIVAHRGCRFNTPEAPETPLYENTLASLKFAQNLKADCVEFDVQLTADDKLIVLHGPNVPGLNKNIQKITFEEARAVVLPGGHQMPSLEEFFVQAKECPEVKMLVEIKTQPSKEREAKLTEMVMDLVKKMRMEEQIEYLSFSSFICDEVHRIDPKAKVIYVESGVFVKAPEWAAEKGYNGISYDYSGFMNHPDYVDRAKKLGLETTLWLVNHYEGIDWAIRHGIDYVSSDRPNKVKAYLEGISAFDKE